MIKRLIQLVFLVVGVIILAQLEYQGRPLKEHVRSLYRSPEVQLLVKWGRVELTRLLHLQGGSEMRKGGVEELEHLSEEDREGLDTILKEVDR